MTDEQIREQAFISATREQIGHACTQVALQTAEIASRDAKIKALEAEIAELKRTPDKPDGA